MSADCAVHEYFTLINVYYILCMCRICLVIGNKARFFLSEYYLLIHIVVTLINILHAMTYDEHNQISDYEMFLELMNVKVYSAFLLTSGDFAG